MSHGRLGTVARQCIEVLDACAKLQGFKFTGDEIALLVASHVHPKACCIAKPCDAL